MPADVTPSFDEDICILQHVLDELSSTTTTATTITTPACSASTKSSDQNTPAACVSSPRESFEKAFHWFANAYIAVLEKSSSPATTRRESGSLAGNRTGMSFQKIQCFKTKQCRYWLEGRCTRGAQCTYAHCDDELRNRPDLTKTKVCGKWKIGECNKPAYLCPYAHGVEELRVVNPPPTILPPLCIGVNSSSRRESLGSKSSSPRSSSVASTTLRAESPRISQPTTSPLEFFGGYKSRARNSNNINHNAGEKLSSATMREFQKWSHHPRACYHYYPPAPTASTQH